jgi:metal-responsive CopG/Arc/MetJ family transcriptional regulator
VGRVAKVTISLPTDTLEAVEREREATGETRSQFFRQLVERHFRQAEKRRQDEEYVRAYQECPETDEERAWAEYGLRMLAEHAWEE